MGEFKDIFGAKYHKRPSGFGRKQHCSNFAKEYSQKDYLRYSESASRKYERNTNHESQSTLCAPNRYSYSKSTLSMPPLSRAPTKSTLGAPLEQEYKRNLERNISNKNISTLPYYIVPVLYVPHKPLYEAKQAIEPHMYKAYHCKSRKQLSKIDHSNDRYNYQSHKIKNSDSLSNIFSKRSKTKKEFEKIYESPRNANKQDYSFEDFDEYFRKYVDNARKSSSDISFGTENSYNMQLPLTPKPSSKFAIDSAEPEWEKRRLISRNFPELFGISSVHNDKGTPESIRPKTQQEVPTWDSPRKTDVFIETDLNERCCISAQTSFAALTPKTTNRDTQGTQTLIKDIKNNVVIIPQEKFNGSIIIGTKVCRSSSDNKQQLARKQSDGPLDEIGKTTVVLNRNTPRSAISKLTKNAEPNLYVLSRKNSKRSTDSVNTNIV